MSPFKNTFKESNFWISICSVGLKIHGFWDFLCKMCVTWQSLFQDSLRKSQYPWLSCFLFSVCVSELCTKYFWGYQNIRLWDYLFNPNPFNLTSKGAFLIGFFFRIFFQCITMGIWWASCFASAVYPMMLNLWTTIHSRQLHTAFMYTFLLS